MLNVSLAFADEQGRPVPKIQDNSFLIEEAYNQEPGVVQAVARCGAFFVAGYNVRDA